MTQEEAIKELDAINADKEMAHVEADAVLIQFLRDNGFADVADAWTNCEERHNGFWYA